MNALAPIARLVVRRAGPQDRPAIEAFLARHPRATPFHRPAWLRAIEQGCGHASHLLVAEANGGISGYLPLTHIRSRLFGSALVSTGFAVGGGILADDCATAERLAAAAAALAGELGCPTVELRGGELPAGWSRKDGVYAGFSRPLPAGDEAILQSIPRKQRAEVRRALGFGLDIDTGGDAAAH